VTSQPVRTPHAKGRNTPSVLDTDGVYALVVEVASATPLSTADITEWCESRFGESQSITTGEVRKLLRYIERRGHIMSVPGTDTARLADLGVTDPHPKQLYWVPRKDT
jgi:hypothetical protein